MKLHEKTFVLHCWEEGITLQWDSCSFSNVVLNQIVHDCWKRTWPADGQEKVSLSLATLEAVGLLLGQPFSIRKVVKTSFRVLLSGWLIFGIVIGTGYKSNLVAVMTLPPAPQRIETLSELAASGLMWVPIVFFIQLT